MTLDKNTSTVDGMSKCECGNAITEDVEMCEWCEYPDAPIYKITPYGIQQMENAGLSVPYDIQGITVWATSIENARLIYADAFPIDDGAE